MPAVDLRRRGAGKSHSKRRRPLPLFALILLFWGGSSVLCYHLISFGMRHSGTLHDGPHFFSVEGLERTAFTLYFGHLGSCGRSTLAHDVPTISLAAAMQSCWINPNCTFFTYSYKMGVADYCSGRQGNALDGAIQVNHQGALEVLQYVSGDKRGCEQYTTDMAVKDNAGHRLPSCPLASTSCGVVNQQTGECISDLMLLAGNGLLLTKNKMKAFCATDGGQITLVARENAEGRSCLWKRDDVATYNFRNDKTGELLLFDQLKYTRSHSMQTKEQCICHNPSSGLVKGPYCGNEDCKWTISDESCWHRNQKSKACLTDILKIDTSDLDAGKKCICHVQDARRIVVQSGANCDDNACQWTVKANGALHNKESKQKIEFKYSMLSPGSLLATPPECLCRNAETGLVIGPYCGNADCIWINPAYPTELRAAEHRQKFEVHANERYQCVLQLEPPILMESLEDALELCLEEPMCTYVAYRPSDGSTEICAGHYKGMDYVTKGAADWYSALRKRCGHLDEGDILQRLLAAEPIICSEEHACSCPAGANMVVGCSEGKDAVCDVCESGYCPELVVESKAHFTLSQMLLHRLGFQKGYRAFNPTLFWDKDDMYAAFRVSNHTFCGGHEADGKEYESVPVICKLDLPTMTVDELSCHQVQISVQDFELGSRTEHPVFKGLEDVRAFQFRDQVHFIGSLNLYQRTTPVSGIETVALGIATLNNALNGHSATYLLKREDQMQRIRQKNWMPLVKDDELFLVAQMSPLQVLKFNVTAKRLQVVPAIGSSSAIDASITGGRPLRGGTPFIETKHGWLTLVHRRVDYPLGPIYAHHFILVTFSPKTSSFELAWVSPAFRLSDIGENSPNDIQFASGLAADKHRLYITYGVEDCVSGLVVLENFIDTLEKGDTPELKLNRPPVEKQRQGVVRWEGPVRDTSSFSTVARELGSRLLDGGVDMEFHDTSNVPSLSRVTHPRFDGVFSNVLLHNVRYLKPPEVVIRMSWPPNLHPPGKSKLIMYLPWEFQGIPKHWVAAINEHATEVWVPSSYNRDIFVAAGIVSSKVAVVPHGVDAACVSRITKPSPPYVRTSKTFRFLYHGGALWRKGVDALLKAYIATFTADDDVTLILAMTYGDDSIQRFIEDTIHALEGGPEIQILSARLTNEEVKILYASVDVYVHPARGEGFGITIAEAMMCGLPVVTTNIGGHMDFTFDSSAFLVESRTVPCDRYPCRLNMDKEPPSIFGWETNAIPMWVEPDLHDLGRKMRQAFEDEDGRQHRAKLAQEWVTRNLTWAAGAEIANARLQQLTRNHRL